MLIQEQQSEYIAFIANYVDHLHEAGIDRKQAQQLTIISASCIMATIFHVEAKQDEEIDTFAVTVINAALRRFYGAYAAESRTVEAITEAANATLQTMKSFEPVKEDLQPPEYTHEYI
jgi:hypothetical protein